MIRPGPRDLDEVRAQAMCWQIDFIAHQQKGGALSPTVTDLEGLIAGVVAWGQCAVSPQAVIEVLQEAQDRLAKRQPTGVRPSLKLIAGSRKG